ncbi:MAG: TetR/AcrR family transcriptional regulator [Spirochaetia bacterium]
MTAAHGRFPAARSRILDFARELFFRYGFTRVTIDEIAAELHISKTTFYRHFKTKEDLLTEVVRAYYGKIRDGISDIMAQGGGGYQEELKNSMFFIGDMLERMDRRARQDIRSSAPETWQTIQQLQSSMVYSVLQKVLRKGIELGVVRPDLDTKLVANVLVVTIENILNGETLHSMAVSMRSAFKVLVDVFLKGVLIEGKKH